MKVLVIQTSFPGDVILASALPESIIRAFPEAEIHFLLRRGNESLFNGHPYLKKVWIWDKKKKWSSALGLIKAIRRERFDLIVNVQRFFMTGLITALSAAPDRRGFDKNPLSFLYTKKVPHVFREGLHETQRNQQLIEDICGREASAPRLYPPDIQVSGKKYVVLAPASVWFTKQWPLEYWSMLASGLDTELDVVLMGGPADMELCSRIEAEVQRPVINACGKYTLLQSAGILKRAAAVVCNDSAPAHLATAVDTPTLQIYCSTDTRFGFQACATWHIIIQTPEALSCRPCSSHGRSECPLQHFRCGKSISPEYIQTQLAELLSK